MPAVVSSRARDMLRLRLTPGVGPVLARRLIAHFGDLDRMLRAAPAEFERVEGIGKKTADTVCRGLRDTENAAAAEIDRCERAGVRLVALGEPAYPPLLAETRDAPTVLYVRGDPTAMTRAYAVGIVGSRGCTPYGIEQTERFSAFLASSGLAIISGGARGIDSAAHRAALRVKGTTVAVVGCGLAHCYPPENADLFQEIANAGGAVVSELPLDTPPAAENFPGRNRVISGLSLGVLVLEAPKGSGALITARCAIDEHGREVMVVPGRIDSPASEGSNELLKKGEGALVTSPPDVLELLEAAARHQWAGTHAVRFATADPTGISGAKGRDPLLFQPDPQIAAGEGSGRPAAATPPPAPGSATQPPKVSPLTDRQQILLAALESPLTFDQLVEATGMDAGVIQAELTVLELRRMVRREGGRYAKRSR